MELFGVSRRTVPFLSFCDEGKKEISSFYDRVSEFSDK